MDVDLSYRTQVPLAVEYWFIHLGQCNFLGAVSVNRQVNILQNSLKPINIESTRLYVSDRAELG